MKSHETLARLTQKNVERIGRMEETSEKNRTLGERIADGFAAVIGSWTFLITQSILLGLWMILNVLIWVHHWDPYPFILLNLALSFQAAFAGPIILMSQNRQSKLMERRNHLDLQIDLLGEQENTEILNLLRQICQKLDISLTNSPISECLAKKTDPNVLVHQIEKMSHPIKKSK